MLNKLRDVIPNELLDQDQGLQKEQIPFTPILLLGVGGVLTIAWLGFLFWLAIEVVTWALS